jgi:hypothetical protein
MTQTSARHRAFSFQRGTTDEVEPGSLDEITFELAGATIQCAEQIDGMQLLLFTAAMGPGIPGAVRAQAMTDFLAKAIPDRRQHATFLKACADASLEIEDIGSICGWLADVYSERPTRSAQSSSAGRTNTGSSSEDSSPSEESTGVDSPQPTSSQ